MSSSTAPSKSKKTSVPRLCQAIVENDLDYVQQWLKGSSAPVLQKSLSKLNHLYEQSQHVGRLQAAATLLSPPYFVINQTLATHATPDMLAVFACQGIKPCVKIAFETMLWKLWQGKSMWSDWEILVRSMLQEPFSRVPPLSSSVPSRHFPSLWETISETTKQDLTKNPTNKLNSPSSIWRDYQWLAQDDTPPWPSRYHPAVFHAYLRILCNTFDPVLQASDQQQALAAILCHAPDIARDLDAIPCSLMGLWGSYVRSSFIETSSEDQELMRQLIVQQLQHVSSQAWEEIFEVVLQKQDECNQDLINASTKDQDIIVKNIEAFLCSLPNARQGWEETHRNANQWHQQVNALMDQGLVVDHHPTPDQEQVRSFESLGCSVGQARLLSSLCDDNCFSGSAPAWINKDCPPSASASPLYTHPSWLHKKISKAGIGNHFDWIISSLLSTSQGRQNFEKCWEHVPTRVQMLHHLSIGDMAKLIQHCPNLMTWKDQHGNTIWHWKLLDGCSAEHAQEKLTKSQANTILSQAKRHPDILFSPNAKGVCAFEIIKRFRILSEEQEALISHHHLQTRVKTSASRRRALPRKM